MNDITNQSKIVEAEKYISEFQLSKTLENEILNIFNAVLDSEEPSDKRKLIFKTNMLELQFELRGVDSDCVHLGHFDKITNFLTIML